MGINNGLFNNYTITPRKLTQYKAFRGVMKITPKHLPD